MRRSPIFFLLSLVAAWPDAESAKAQVLRIKHAPRIDGTILGSVQVATPEDVVLGEGANIDGDLLVPGSPEVRIGRGSEIEAYLKGGGAAEPSGQHVTLLPNAHLTRLVTQSEPGPWLEAEEGELKSIAKSKDRDRRETIGRNQIEPASGRLTRKGIVLGIADSIEPKRYELSERDFAVGDVTVVGPVIVSMNGSIRVGRFRIGNPKHPEWLELRLRNGNLTLLPGAGLYGFIFAPDGDVELEPGSSLMGGVLSSGLMVHRHSTIRVVAPPEPPPRLPFFVSFERSGGYEPGALDGVHAWRVDAGGVEITASEAFDGEQSVDVLPGESVSKAELPVAGADLGTSSIVFIDLFARPWVGMFPEDGSQFDAGMARVGFVRNGENGVPVACVDDLKGGVEWIFGTAEFALNERGSSRDWIRLTYRIDFASGNWDLSLDGRLALIGAEIPPAGTIGAGLLDRIAVTGGASEDTYFDYLYAGFENPLFVDVDSDGMEDRWESAHGLDPGLDDRASDADGDGLSAIEEFRRGSDPENFFNNVEPVLSALYGGVPGPEDDIGIAVLRHDGTPWVNAPVLFRIATGQRRIAATPGGSGLATELNVRTDASGVARVFLEPIEP